MTKVAALYARVSTLDQSCDLQLEDLRRYGHGNLSGKVTVNLNGQFVTDFTASGNYTVDSDCTGTMSGLFNGNPLNIRFVIVDNGKRLIHIGADIGSVAFGEFVRQ